MKTDDRKAEEECQLHKEREREREPFRGADR